MLTNQIKSKLVEISFRPKKSEKSSKHVSQFLVSRMWEDLYREQKRDATWNSHGASSSILILPILYEESTLINR